MPPSKTKLFGEIAITKGLLTQEHLDEALVVQGKQKADGKKKTLGAVLHDLGYLSLVQINAIMEEVAAERRRGSIEGYKIISKLGKGGMGSVYLAKQTSLQKLVAIKVLPPRLAANDDDLARFKREALSTGKLNHPNIVHAYDVGDSNGYNYLVMEYVEGETLKDALEREGTLSESRAIEIVEQLADGLKHAWEHGIVHRDIKPANVMLTKDTGLPKLLDLGLAISKKEDFTITQTGVIMGTPFYLSPEQARSEEVDIRSDIYSLGMTLYHIVVGQPPFVGDSAAIIVAKHLTETIPDPLERNPKLSNGICYIISKMTAKERDDRYQTPEDLLQDIRELRTLSYIPGKEWKGGVRRVSASRGPLRRTAELALVAVPLILLLGLTVLVPESWSRAHDRLRGRPRDLVELPANQGIDVHALEKLAEADRFAAEHPDSLDEARERFERIVREHGASSAIGTGARDRILKIVVRTSQEAQERLYELAGQAGVLRASGKFDEARGLLNGFPARFARTPWWDMHKRELQLIDEAEAAAKARRHAPPGHGEAPPATPTAAGSSTGNP